MTAAAFLDLDGTVCVNARRAGRRSDLAELETFATGRTVTTTAVAARLADWTARDVWVPATTRSRAQYLRLQLPGGRPRWAIAENGATILRDGAPDPAWHEQLQRDLDSSGWDAQAAVHELGLLPGEWRARTVEGAFCYATTDSDDADTLAEASAQLSDVAARQGWVFSAQGRKCYLLPPQVSKERAASHLADLLGLTHVVAAGDSVLDAGLLTLADVAVRPAHGELHRVGWACDGLVVAGGEDPLSCVEALTELVDAALAGAGYPREAMSSATPG